MTKPIQAVLCAYPDIIFTILKDGPYRIVRETVRCRDTFELGNVFARLCFDTNYTVILRRNPDRLFCVAQNTLYLVRGKTGGRECRRWNRWEKLLSTEVMPSLRNLAGT